MRLRWWRVAGSVADLRPRWGAGEKHFQKSAGLIGTGGEALSTNRLDRRLAGMLAESQTLGVPARCKHAADGHHRYCLLSRLKTLVFFYFPTDGNSVSLAAPLFMESRPISAQLSAGYRFTTAHWDGDRRPITGSWACKASICGGNTEQIKPEEPTCTHNPIRAGVMTLHSVLMHTKVS